jgi:3alpha(or 20beta)-hydroxysteroid dehydrogenase
MGRLDGKVAIVTGAARGQGEAEARLFVQEGARVVLGDVLDEPGRLVAKELGDAAEYVHLDVSSESDWAQAVATAEQRFGPATVLVNNAAIIRPAAIEDTSLADYMAVINVNQVGTFLGMRAVIPGMKAARSGSIINISSIDGVGSKNGLISYTASKFAIRGMTKTAAIELGHHGIRVNSIHPGGVNTVMGNPANDLEAMNFVFQGKPIPRIGEPIEIAYMALFLASDEASYCTGAEFMVDGGWTCGDLEPGLPGSPIPGSYGYTAPPS